MNYEKLSLQEIKELEDFFDSLQKDEESFLEAEFAYYDSLEKENWKKVV